MRRLYLEQGLTQSQVADELRTTPKVISNLMARHGIEARPDVVTAGTHRNSPGTSTLAAYRAELDAADITPADLRAWARANGIEVPVTGLPPRHVFHTYLAAQAPDEPQPPASPLVRAFTYAPPDHLAALTAAVSNFLAALQAFTPATPFQEQ